MDRYSWPVTLNPGPVMNNAGRGAFVVTLNPGPNRTIISSQGVYDSKPLQVVRSLVAGADYIGYRPPFKIGFRLRSVLSCDNSFPQSKWFPSTTV